MKIWSLQVARFWAALAVVHFHAAATVAWATHKVGVLGLNASQFGRCGVDLFFVISGVIITLTARGLSAPEFIGKRARRIFPLYFLMGIPCLAVAAMGAEGVGWRDVLTSLTLWPVTDRITAPILQPAWTLCYELVFYAAAAMVIWKPRALWLLLGAYALALALRAGPLLQFLGNPIIVEFLLGVGIAYAPRWKPALALIPLGLAVLIFAAPLGYHTFEPADVMAGREGWQRLIYMGLPAAAVIWGVMQMEARPGLMTYLGDASYSLYLVHSPIMLALVTVLARFAWMPPDLMILIAMGVSILVAWRVYELFERPMLRWLSRPRAILPVAGPQASA